MSRLNLFLIFLPTLVLLLIFGTFGLGVDEAHYMVYGRHLDLSYFDHPPLVGWVHFLLSSLFGENLFSARLPAILVGLFSSWSLFQFLREEGFSEDVAAWSTFAMQVCLQFFVLHVFFLPDTLLFGLIWPLMHVTSRLGQKSSFRDWIYLGVLLGLCGLAKYTAVFFLVPIIAVLLPRQGFSFLRQSGFYVAVLIAVLLISPVMIWNMQRDWISFRYQGAHVLGEDHGFESVFKSWAAQFVLYSPVLWGFSLLGIWKLWGRSSLPARFSFWTATTYGLFFLYSSTNSVVLPHWPALFYLFALPWGLAEVLRGARAWIAKTAIGITASLVTVVAVLLVSGVGYAIPDALKEVGGWPELMKVVAGRVQDLQAEAVFQGLSEPSQKPGAAFLNWTYGSRALYYGRAIESDIYILDTRVDQFDLWNPSSPIGRDLLIVQFSYDEKDLSGLQCAQGLGEREVFLLSERGSLVYDLILRVCRNYQGSR